jgi:hypothetical protein
MSATVAVLSRHQRPSTHALRGKPDPQTQAPESRYQRKAAQFWVRGHDGRRGFRKVLSYRIHSAHRQWQRCQMLPDKLEAHRIAIEECLAASPTMTFPARQSSHHGYSVSNRMVGHRYLRSATASRVLTSRARCSSAHRLAAQPRSGTKQPARFGGRALMCLSSLGPKQAPKLRDPQEAHVSGSAAG